MPFLVVLGYQCRPPDIAYVRPPDTAYVRPPDMAYVRPPDMAYVRPPDIADSALFTRQFFYPKIRV